jgi:hypothetical protein
MSVEHQLISKLGNDVRFLAKRAQIAGFYKHSYDRDFGMSANSLCSLAYGQITLDQIVAPGNIRDYNTCQRLYEQLPEHRRRPEVKKALEMQKKSLKVQDEEVD